MHRTASITALLSTLSLAPLLGVTPPSTPPIDLENHPGRAIYDKMCVECHGPKGEGTEDSDADVLFGSRSIESLAGRIERTMPEDEEDHCVGEEAEKVAEYIYHAFYSPDAQARLYGVSRDLTRLTGPQLKNSVTDLIGSFRNASHPPEIQDHGLKANYTLDDKKKAGNNDFEKQKFERVDPRIRFDYGKGIPELPKGMETELTQFRVNWRGSISVPETGEYEFTIRTRNGAKLYVNEHDGKKEPTIDAWVAPNNEIREESGKVHLLGGRRYFLRLEFFRYQEPKSYVELLWKTPHGVRETVPSRVLTPGWSRERFVSTTPMPADDRSDGYERGTSVSRVWFDAVTSTGFEAAEHVAEHLEELAGINEKKDGEAKRSEKIRNFAREFVARAFRRPLTEQEVAEHVTAHFKKADGRETAVRRIVLYAITSPQFLYPDTSFDSPSDPWARASALALALWDSVPDDQLRKAARSGKLENPQEVRKQAARMIHDSRTRHKMRGFFHHWLELSRAENVAKDDELYPQFSPEVMADLRKSLHLFLEAVVWSEDSDYRRLLLSRDLFLNPKLAKIYDNPGKREIKGGFEKVSFPKQGRTGVITHPYLLTNLAYHDNSSPIHRGVFLTRNIAGLPLRPPPEAVEFEDSDFDPDMTMREKVTKLTRAKACMACHSTINPLGFSLEHYDAMGRWRAKEEGRPIDDDSVLETDGGDRVDIKGPRDVAKYAANSPAAHSAFVRQLFHHVAKQPLLAYGPGTADRLERQFRERGFNIRALLQSMAVTAAQPTQFDS